MKMGDRFKCHGCSKITTFTAAKKKYCSRKCFIKYWLVDAKAKAIFDINAVSNRITANIFKDPKTTCWIWQGKLNKNGYGKIKIGYKTWLAHRASYLVFVGDIGFKMFICHKCDNPSCVNPEHLFQGTYRDNMMDMMSKGRERYAQGENTNLNKISELDVVWIRKNCIRYHSELGVSSIADKFGLSRSHVSNILNGKFWKCLQ